MAGLESRLRYYCVKELRRHGAWAYSTGPTSLVGTPDIIACLPGGRFLGIETKQEGKDPSEVQKFQIEAILRRGGTAVVIRTRAELRALLHRLGLSKPSVARGTTLSGSSGKRSALPSVRSRPVDRKSEP